MVSSRGPDSASRGLDRRGLGRPFFFFGPAPRGSRQQTYVRGGFRRLRECPDRLAEGRARRDPSISATRVFTIDSPRLREARQSNPGGNPRPSSLISTRSRPFDGSSAPLAPRPTGAAQPVFHGVLAELGDDHGQAGRHVGRQQSEAALPDRRRPRPQEAATSPIIRSRPSATRSNSTISSKAWDSVSCTIAIGGNPGHRIVEGDLRLRGGDATRLHPEQCSHRLQVVLHPVVDLPDGRVLGDQLGVPCCGRSLTSRHSTIAPTRSRPAEQTSSTRTIRWASPDTSSVRRAMRPDITEATESSTGAEPAGEQGRRQAWAGVRRSGHRSARAAGTRSAHSGWRTRTFPYGVDPDETVPHPRVECQVGHVVG